MYIISVTGNRERRKSMDSIRLKYTANFKRDYVAAAALVIFFLIVCGEIFIAVSLPIYMNREAALAVSVRRLRLMESFDFVRSRAKALKLKDDTSDSEASLLKWNLDLMAAYLRKYSQYLTGEQLAVLQQQLNDMDAAITQLSTGKHFSREYRLNCTPYINMVLQKSGVANVK